MWALLGQDEEVAKHNRNRFIHNRYDLNATKIR